MALSCFRPLCRLLDSKQSPRPGDRAHGFEDARLLRSPTCITKTITITSRNELADGVDDSEKGGLLPDVYRAPSLDDSPPPPYLDALVALPVQPSSTKPAPSVPTEATTWTLTYMNAPEYVDWEPPAGVTAYCANMWQVNPRSWDCSVFVQFQYPVDLANVLGHKWQGIVPEVDTAAQDFEAFKNDFTESLPFVQGFAGYH